MDATDADGDNFTAIKGLRAAPDMTLKDSIDFLIFRVVDLQGIDLETDAYLATKWARKHPDAVLNTEQVAAIYFYTLETNKFYSTLNRGMIARSRAILLPFFPYLKLFCGGLYLLPLPATPQTIYRGVKRHLYGNSNNGDDLIFWCFSSATASVEVLSEFLGQEGERTQLLIATRSYVDIRRFSAYPLEDERLFLPGTMLSLKSKLNCGHGLIQIQLCDQPGPPLMDFSHPQLHGPTTAMTMAVGAIQVNPIIIPQVLFFSSTQ